jgi:hypothetical protein
LSRYREEVYDRNREFEPIFVGPGSVTPLLDLAEAKKDPIWAAFCAAMHCRGPLGITAAAVAIEAGAELPADARRCTLQLIIAGMEKDQMQEIQNRVSEPIKHELSEYERQGAWYLNGVAKGVAEGVAKGFQRALLNVLAVRGLDPDAEQRARIEACDDADQLLRWHERAMQAASVAAIFDIDP